MADCLEPSQPDDWCAPVTTLRASVASQRGSSCGRQRSRTTENAAQNPLSQAPGLREVTAKTNYVSLTGVPEASRKPFHLEQRMPRQKKMRW